MAGRILLVEDDLSIREMTEIGLEGSGFEVTAVGDGASALQSFGSGSFDAVVLDVMLPHVSGLEVCRRIRDQSGVPIVMLTARGDTIDVVLGLEAGADDYVRKPFDMPELVARLRAAIRRVSAPGGEDRMTLGDLVIVPHSHLVTRADVEIPVTATEFKVLVELASRPGRVFTRELLLELVWGYDYLGDSRLVDVAVQRLRSKIEHTPSQPELILTVRGAGYKARA